MTVHTGLKPPRVETAVSVSTAFQNKAETVPERRAVSCGSEALTYHELYERVTRVAAGLRSMGVGRETAVAVMTDRSVDTLSAILGVLRSGGYYIPIDPEYPAARIDYMLEDSGARVVITDKPEALPSGATTQVLPLDCVTSRPHECVDGACYDSLDESLAYAIYTSGSTGRPKAVGISRRSLASFLAAALPVFALDDSSRFAAVSTLCFDIAALELFLPLAAGAEVVLIARNVGGDGRSLIRCLDQNHVTAMQATPVTWRLLVDAGWRPRPRFGAFCGGEALSPGLATALVARGTRLKNLYGPTEATIWATHYQVSHRSSAADSNPRADPQVRHSIPIGQPFANTTAVVLNQDTTAVEQGETGELALGGFGVARGYLGNPRLTADRFVPDPQGQPGSRLFRTGDLACYSDDGLMHFLGRRDGQVKLRGVRIELAEIESVLERHPDVAQAVVDIVGADDSAQLIAFVQPRRGIDESDLRAIAVVTLPSYMVPAAFRFVADLPQTLNRKIDRVALRESASLSVYTSASNELIRDELSERLARIYAEVLCVADVSPHESFFELGGTSLTSAQLLGRINDSFGVVLPMKALFLTPRVNELAVEVRTALEKKK